MRVRGQGSNPAIMTGYECGGTPGFGFGGGGQGTVVHTLVGRARGQGIHNQGSEAGGKAPWCVWPNDELNAGLLSIDLW